MEISDILTGACATGALITGIVQGFKEVYDSTPRDAQGMISFKGVLIPSLVGGASNILGDHIEKVVDNSKEMVKETITNDALFGAGIVFSSYFVGRVLGDLGERVYHEIKYQLTKK
jgi:hypothetical protein